MNEFNQVVLSLLVLVSGGIWLFPYRHRLNALLYWSYAWLLGWGLVVLGTIVPVLLGVTASPSRITLSTFTVGVMMYWIVKSVDRDDDTYSSQVNPIGSWRTKAVVFSLLCLGVFCAAYYGKYVFHSTDSLVYEGIGQNFHLLGFHGPPLSLRKMFIHIRLPFLGSVLNIGYHANVQVFYSFFPQIALVGYLLVLGHGIDSSPSSTLYFSSFIPITFFLYWFNPNLILQSFLHHANFLAGVYFAGGTFCIYEYIKDTENKNFHFLLATLFLGLSCIIRKEMLFFSLLPFLYLQLQRRYPARKAFLTGVTTYLLVAYGWFLVWFLRQLFSYGLSSVGKQTYHGGWIVIFVCLIFAIFTFGIRGLLSELGVSPSPRLSFLVMLSGGLSLLVVVAWLRPDLYRRRFFHLQYHLFTPVGRWGLVWHLVLLATIGQILTQTVKLLFKRNFAVVEAINTDGTNYLFFVIGLFFLGWLGIYTLYETPTSYLFTDSGNRIIILAFLPAVYLLANWTGQLFKVSYNAIVLK